MRSVRNVGQGFFPLDEELELYPGAVLTPWLRESLVRLGTWMPFARSAKMLTWFTGVEISEKMARQITEEAGKALVSMEETFVKEIISTTPAAPKGGAVQLLSVDGCFVLLVGGAWKEVKTLTLGEVQPAQLEKGVKKVHSTNLSYFSRLADADSFTQASLGEIQRRGVEGAKVVCAVSDGATWIQGLVDEHCPQAVRILDFWHAAEHLAAAGKAVYAYDTPKFEKWFAAQRELLQAGKSSEVLSNLKLLSEETTSSEAKETINKEIAYLTTRTPMLAYDKFSALGYPIGSGSAESANKIVVQARLKGVGMRWAEDHVNPMLALRGVVCNDRWEQLWPQVRPSQLQARLTRVQLRLDRRRQTTRLGGLEMTNNPTLPQVLLLEPEPPPQTSTKLLPPLPPYSWKNPFLRRPPSKN